MPWVVVAFAATVAHLLIDQHIGLYGAISQTMTGWEAVNVARHAVVAGLWMAASVAATHSVDARRALQWLAVVDAALLNGAVAFAVAPPPSDAFPYQDVAHGLALVFGAGAAFLLAKNLAEAGKPQSRRWRISTVVILVVSQLLGLGFFIQMGFFG